MPSLPMELVDHIVDLSGEIEHRIVLRRPRRLCPPTGMAEWLPRRRVVVWENDVMMWTIFVPFHRSRQYTTTIDRQRQGIISVSCHLVDFTLPIMSNDVLLYSRDDPRNAGGRPR